MTLSIVAILGGFLVLVYGADRFVYGAAGTANALGVSPMIIGLTVVGFGTSAPEIIVSGTAAWQGNPGLGFGNAIGSNIANIALVLGITALVTPLMVGSLTLKREMPALLVVTCGTSLLVYDGEITRLDSGILLLAIVVLITMLAYIAIMKKRSDPIEKEYLEEIPTDLKLSKAILWLLAGLVLLLLSSKVLVWGAIDIAQQLGISDLVIGLTIVAIGTSLPELAASVMSAIKREHDLVIGNIIGSNMFNLLAVIGVAGMIHPGAFPEDALSRDIPVMLALTVMLLAMVYSWRGKGRINRVEGGILLLCFISYLVWLLYTATA